MAKKKDDVTSKLEMQVNTIANHHYIPTVGLEGLIFARAGSVRKISTMLANCNLTQAPEQSGNAP